MGAVIVTVSSAEEDVLTLKVKQRTVQNASLDRKDVGFCVLCQRFCRSDWPY